MPLEKAGVPILGTSPDAIDRAEDRERFAALIDKLGLRQPENGMARSAEEAFAVARRIGYPVMVRPSYVLGGRAMEIVYDDADLRALPDRGGAGLATSARCWSTASCEDAIEVDVDVVSDGKDVVVGGIMEHIEEAGIHSGDSACALPPLQLSPDAGGAEIERAGRSRWPASWTWSGLMNVQFAVQGEDIYVLEVNPRASRHRALRQQGHRRAAGQDRRAVHGWARRSAELGLTPERRRRSTSSVKEAVFPFARFPGVDAVLGPEMKSTGEVMGIAADFYGGLRQVARSRPGTPCRCPGVGNRSGPSSR